MSQARTRNACATTRGTSWRCSRAQIVADPADHDLPGVEAQADGEVQAAGDAELVRVAAQRVAQVQRRVAGALGVVLVRDRRPEERHDAVAGVLIHRALEAVDAVGEHLKEAVHGAVPLLGIELLGELHRALHVGKQYRHLLALALEGRAGGQDLLDEVTRRVRNGRRRWVSGGGD
jgi:hypothetical protein